jgi:hypothetical protein
MRLLLFFLIPFVGLSQTDSKPTWGCSPSMNFSYLDINNIKTPVYSGGDLHFNLFGNGLPAYEFPKGSGKSAAGASGLWIGGINSVGQLKIACQTYRQGIEFWPGPLNGLDGSISSLQCASYDRIWKVNYTDINDFITNYNNGNVQNNMYMPASSILSWPALDTVVYPAQKLAPFIDVNNDGKYNPKVDGDYPDIKGDQTLYHIFNDNGNSHTNTGGQVIGVQINATTYAYGCPQVVNGKPELLNTTFYNYKIYNRTNFNLIQTYIGVWVDATIGNWQDDYVGSNPQKGYAFAYNGSGNDSIYGNILPATGTVMLKAPKATLNDGIDNDNDGVTDELNEELLTPDIYYYNHLSSGFMSSNPAINDPQNAAQFYQYLNGYWRDGSPYTCGGYAYGGTTITKHVFPGSQQTNTVCVINWTEKNLANTPGDRCYLLSVGPFDFNGRDSTEIEFAFVTSIDSSSVGNTDGSIIKLESDIDKIKNFYYSSNKQNCLGTIDVSINELIKNSLTIFPNPVNDKMTCSSSYLKNTKSKLIFSDVLGKEVSTVILGEESNTIDMSLFSKGIYFAAFCIQNERITYKIIKQ